MSTTTTIIGPEHRGQKMSLEEFDNAAAREGYLYELSRGVVAVIDVPRPRHGYLVEACRRQFTDFCDAQPGTIHIFGSNECKLLVPETQTERHPDLAIYLSRCPNLDADVWSQWIPEIVIEVVSKSSSHRDYVEKRKDYLQAGVQEYWIIDAGKQQMTVLQRSGDQWTEHVINPREIYSTHLLPGLKFDCRAVFDAAQPPEPR